jgi:NAD(P)-dependent dehydrogenase (short-subunit alcohol dehydrogenase family)
MATYLITGGARGLGLALAKHLVSLPTSQVSRIIVSVRKPSADLETIAQASDRMTVVQFDVTDEATIQKAVPAIEAALGSGRGLDVLINNSGVAHYAGKGTKSM